MQGPTGSNWSSIMRNFGIYWFIKVITVKKTKNDWAIFELTLRISIQTRTMEADQVKRVKGSFTRYNIKFTNFHFCDICAWLQKSFVYFKFFCNLNLVELTNCYSIFATSKLDFVSLTHNISLSQWRNNFLKTDSLPRWDCKPYPHNVKLVSF